MNSVGHSPILVSRISGCAPSQNNKRLLRAEPATFASRMPGYHEVNPPPLAGPGKAAGQLALSAEGGGEAHAT